MEYLLFFIFSSILISIFFREAQLKAFKKKGKRGIFRMFLIQIISSILILFVVFCLVGFILSTIDGGPAVFALGFIILVPLSVLLYQLLSI